MAYIKRAAENTIAQVSKMFPVLLVTGPRQVGKTTLLQRMAEAQQSEGITECRKGGFSCIFW